MRDDFERFSVEEFLRQYSIDAGNVELLAEVFDDGDYLVIRPEQSVGGTVYKLQKQSVVIEPADGGTDGKWRRVTVPRTAACVRLTAATVAEFFDRGLHSITHADVLQARIAFTKNGEGSLSFGSTTTPCLGNPTVMYSKDLTVQGQVGVDKFPRKFSNEFNVWMDYAILIMGQRGIYIHEGAATLETNGGRPSAGCIHVAPPDAKVFYDWVSGPTRILISYPW